MPKQAEATSNSQMRSSEAQERASAQRSRAPQGQRSGTSLATLRDAIDKFDGDLGRYPASLEELTQRQYIREVPVDPVTGRPDTWVVSAPPSDAVVANVVGDVHSGAPGVGLDGTPYHSY